MNLFGRSPNRGLSDDVANLSSDLSALVGRLAHMAMPERRSSYSDYLPTMLGGRQSHADMVRDYASSGMDTVWRGVHGAADIGHRRPALAAMALVGLGVVLGMMARR